MSDCVDDLQPERGGAVVSERSRGLVLGLIISPVLEICGSAICRKIYVVMESNERDRKRDLLHVVDMHDILKMSDPVGYGVQEREMEERAAGSAVVSTAAEQMLFCCTS